MDPDGAELSKLASESHRLLSDVHGEKVIPIHNPEPHVYLSSSSRLQTHAGYTRTCEMKKHWDSREHTFLGLK